jgi:hypothetical protein
MEQQGFVLNPTMVHHYMVQRGMRPAGLVEEDVCSERYLRLALNEGQPVSYDVLTRLARALSVAREELLANPDDRERVRGSDHNAAINRFYAAMLGGLADEALKEFTEGAKLHLHLQPQEVRSLFGAGARESGEFEGRTAIGGALRRICALAKVEEPKELRRTPLPNDRVLSEGRVTQEIASNKRQVTYDFVLIFDFAQGGGIEKLDLHFHFDTREIAEGLQSDGPP